MWNELVELRTRCDGLMDTLMELIVALAASNGRYVDFCLDMLVSNFIPPFNFLEILKQPRGLAKKDQVIIRVHLSLKGIADLVPLAPSRLEQIVRERVPNVFSKEAPQKKYSGRKVLWGNVVAQKLDALMDLTFDHLQSCFKNGRLHQVFKALLQSFQSTVLNAYKSKFAQFVVFYACSLDPETCGRQFESKLLEIFCSTIYPQDWRMSAVAYLASYLSRAKFLSTEDVTIILKSLVDWCYKYCKNQSGEINPKNHRVFYAGCQAVMYVLCFRMRSILATFQLKSQLLNMPLEQIFKHPLDPLEVCLPSIVEEFLHQAKAAGLFSVSDDTFVFHHLLESDMSRAFGGFQRLDVFFPFDPYLLKKSERFIRPNFIYWSMVRPTYDDEDDDDGSINDEDDGDDDYDVDRQERKMQMPSRIRPSTSPESL